MFPTPLAEILERLEGIQPERYAATRNFGDGAVTYLSPYISRGVISTRKVYESIQALGLPWERTEKLVQELAWRDYWQQVWIARGDEIHTDLKNVQAPVSNHQIPAAIVEEKTGIHAVDEAIIRLYQTGYMHNHMRMYVASICCNIARCHWKEPARWMYAHLLDGDLASNQLSWQWVAGAFSHKKYFANQDNINKYFHSTQQNTFLDIAYEEFDTLETPEVLKEVRSLDVHTPLDESRQPKLDKNRKTLVYNYYNIDPFWHSEGDYQRVFLLEPELFRQFPVAQKCLDFALALTGNIKGMKVFVGSFAELYVQLNAEQIIYKEHPLNRHYKGTEEPRDWLCGTTGYFPSFFAFWKKCKKELQRAM